MIQLNRIGYKLGLAGAVGVLLSIGMVANQMVTESTVAGVNDRASRSQAVADSTLTAHLNMRQMQLAGRATRLARSTAEVDKSVVDVRRYNAVAMKEIDSAFASALKPETRERLQKIKALMESYTGGVEDLAKAQSSLLTLMDKRTAISTEWEKAFEAQLASTALAELANRKDVELLLYQADGKIKGLRSAIWRFSATGEESQKKTIALNKTALEELLDRIRGASDDKAFKGGIDAMKSIVTRYIAANDETIKAEDLKTDILANRTVKVVNDSGELMEAAVANAQKNTKISRDEVASETARANSVNMVMAIVVVIAIVGSVLFSFLGIARPMTRLNGALGQMAAGNLDIEIPGADRGDEIGDLAKTVTVIRENAEQKARDEAEAKATQDQLAARQRKADMVKMADDFESAVGEIVETVSSASTELEASASTLTSTAERAEELATLVAAASEEASTNVQSVASATEEMASSVNEISRQVQ
jgi:methyl-accepting chemotaxis protein